MPCCCGFPGLLMKWKETKSWTLFSSPLSATRRREATLNRMEMTSWMLIIYLCTFFISSHCLDISSYLKNIYLKLSVIKGWETKPSWICFFFFFPFGGNWSVRVIPVNVDFTRWSQSKCYILKLHSRLKLTYIYMTNSTNCENLKITGVSCF